MSVSSNDTALFIDGANLYATAKALGFDIDYRRLLKEFQSRGTLLRAFYYTAIIEDQEFTSIRPLIDWLDYNGYTVVTKATKEFIDASGRRKVKGNMDIELAVDAMELAEHVDQIVLFSGDGDFRSLVEAVQRRGVRVTVVSTISSQPPMIADELRRQADVFTDLVELQSKLGRSEEHTSELQSHVNLVCRLLLDIFGHPARSPLFPTRRSSDLDQIVLFSGDGDFRSLVEAVQRRGVRVTVVSTISSQPPMIADELRRQADVFTDLVELQSKLGRDPSERPAPREPRHHSPQFLQRATTMAPRTAGA